MKDKNIAAILAFPLFGGWGAHKFYLGQVGAGIVYLAFAWTLIPAIVSFFEFIILALMDRDEFNRRYNGTNVLGASPVVVNMLPPAAPYYPPYPPRRFRRRRPGIIITGPWGEIDLTQLAAQLGQPQTVRPGDLLDTYY